MCSRCALLLYQMKNRLFFCRKAKNNMLANKTAFFYWTSPCEEPPRCEGRSPLALCSGLHPGGDDEATDPGGHGCSHLAPLLRRQRWWVEGLSGLPPGITTVKTYKVRQVFMLVDHAGHSIIIRSCLTILVNPVVYLQMLGSADRYWFFFSELESAQKFI